MKKSAKLNPKQPQKVDTIKMQQNEKTTNVEEFNLEEELAEFMSQYDETLKNFADR